MGVDPAQWRKEKAERIARGESKSFVPVEIPTPPSVSEVGAMSTVPDEIAKAAVEAQSVAPRARWTKKKE